MTAIILAIVVQTNTLKAAAPDLYLSATSDKEEIFDTLAIAVTKHKDQNHQALQDIYNTFIHRSINTTVDGAISKIEFDYGTIKDFDTKFYQAFLNYPQHFNFYDLNLALDVYATTFIDLSADNQVNAIKVRNTIIAKINAMNFPKNITQIFLELELTADKVNNKIYLIDFILSIKNVLYKLVKLDKFEKVVLDNLSKYDSLSENQITILMNTWFKIFMLNPTPAAAENSMLNMFSFVGERPALIASFKSLYDDVLNFTKYKTSTKYVVELNPVQMVLTMNHGDISTNNPASNEDRKIQSEKFLQLYEGTNLELYFQTFNRLSETQYNVGRLNELYQVAPVAGAAEINELGDLYTKEHPTNKVMCLNYIFKFPRFFN